MTGDPMPNAFVPGKGDLAALEAEVTALGPQVMGFAVAARFAPAGLGTDTGGSTRVPASFCGIAGFRPSVGDGAGQGRRYPDTATDALPISTTRDTVGPMGRTVADVALLDAVITGDASLPAMPLARVRLGLPRPLWISVYDSANVGPDALADSRAVLAAWGNMSSATILFVLARMMERQAKGDGLAIAFGPGLAAEAIRFTAPGKP